VKVIAQLSSQTYPSAAQSVDPLAVVREQRYRAPLLVGMSLMLFQQITGQPSVLYYASSILAEAGISPGAEASGKTAGHW
jgi:hypothetical protein